MKHLLWILLAALLLTGCGDEGRFRIEGHIDGNPSMNLYVAYYGKGAVRHGVIVARDGAFEFEGSSAEPVMVEFFDNSYNVLARAYVRNGDDVRIDVVRGNPYLLRARGSEMMELWSQAMAPIADSLRDAGAAGERNAILERAIARWREEPAAALMFAAYYDGSLDPARADSVLESIPADVRTAPALEMYAALASPFVKYGAVDSMRFKTSRDTLYAYAPQRHRCTLLAFSLEQNFRSDTLVPELRRLSKKFPERELMILDFEVTSDSFAWRRSVRRDTASWRQPWVPGGLISPQLDTLAVPAVPYYIVCDSTGRHLYRGTSLPEAVATVNK